MTARRDAAAARRKVAVAVAVAVVMALILAGATLADAALGDQPGAVVVSGVAAAVAGVLTGQAGRWLAGRGPAGGAGGAGAAAAWVRRRLAHRAGRERAGNPVQAYAGWVLRGCLAAGAGPAVRAGEPYAMRVTAVVVAGSLHGRLTGTDLRWAGRQAPVISAVGSRVLARQAAVLLEVMGLSPDADGFAVSARRAAGLSDREARRMLARVARQARAMALSADRVAAAVPTAAEAEAVADLPAGERDAALALLGQLARLVPALVLHRLWDGLRPGGMPAPFRSLANLLARDPADWPALVPDPPYCPAQIAGGADIGGSAFTFIAHDCTDMRAGRIGRLGRVGRLGRAGRRGGRVVTELFGYFREPGTIEDDARLDEALQTAVLVVRRRSRLGERARRIATDPTGQPQKRVGEILRVNVALCPCTSRRRCPALSRASLIKAVDHAFE
jgi:hypothetical protein